MKRLFLLKLTAVDKHEYLFRFQEEAGTVEFSFKASWDENGHQGLISRDMQFVHRIASDEAGYLVDRCIARFDVARLKALKEQGRVPVSIQFLGEAQPQNYFYRVEYRLPEGSGPDSEEFCVAYDDNGDCKISSPYGTFSAELNDSAYLILWDGEAPCLDLQQAILFFDESRYYKLKAEDEVFRVTLKHQ